MKGVGREGVGERKGGRTGAEVRKYGGVESLFGGLMCSRHERARAEGHAPGELPGGEEAILRWERMRGPEVMLLAARVVSGLR